MPTLTYADKTVEVDAEGYMTRSLDWTRELGEAIAAELGLALLPDHWKAIEYARSEFTRSGQTPGVRKITLATGISMKEIYRLFPKGPAKLIARIGGIPKPKSCV